MQADKDKKVKKKKAKEDAPAEEAAAPAAAAPAPSSGSERQSSRGSRKAKRTGSNVFSMFTQKQVAEFKEVRNTLHSDALIIASLNIYETSRESWLLHWHSILASPVSRIS